MFASCVSTCRKIQPECGCHVLKRPGGNSPSAGVDEATARVAPAKMAMASVIGKLSLQFLGEPAVVGIEKRDPRCTRGRDASIAEPRKVTRVLALVDLDARVRERFQPLDRLVSGAVVDNDQFPVLDGLGPNGVDRLSQESETIESRQDD